MGEFWIAVLGLAATTMLVVVGLLNFSIFRKQLKIAPDLQLIDRAIAEASDHVRVIVERPYLRQYFYDGAEWREGDQASRDEVKAMGELMLNNFASALMHSAAFPQYPVRGIDRTIMFHMRNSPVLRELLVEMFDRFPFTGLSLLALMNYEPADVDAQLSALIQQAGLDVAEIARRKELLQLYRERPAPNPIDYTMFTMQRRR
jgi:hypothetical protein